MIFPQINTETMFLASKEVDLDIKTEKTKYMLRLFTKMQDKILI
jgi:hypothetical protein